MKRLFVPGVFDVFHVGHLNYLKNAASQGDHVIVGIQDDRAVHKCKGVRPVIALHDRMAIIENLRFVDEVISYTAVFQGPLLAGLEIDVFACGEEYGNDERYPEQVRTLQYCQEHGIDVVRIPRTEQISSTQIRGRLKEFWESRSTLENELTAGVTVLGSFQGNQDKVSEETRREVELILSAVDIPEAKSLLDLGCGDGRQTALLANRFARTVGVDFSPGLLSLAEGRIAAQGGQATLIESDVASFRSPETFDVILLSGIIPCLDDLQMEDMLAGIQSMSHPGTSLLVRSSIGLEQRINVVNQFSQELKSRYTAYYRTPAEIEECFLKAGFQLQRHESLYQHREDSAVWWFEFGRQLDVAKPHMWATATDTRPRVAQMFQD